jgi:hypothetical protein
VRARCDGADDPERRVLFVCDAVIAAERVRLQPFNAGNHLDDLQFLDLVIQATDLRLVQLDAAPGFRMALDDLLDDRDDAPPRVDALRLQLEIRLMCRGAGLVDIPEHAEGAAARMAGRAACAGARRIVAGPRD